jgi:hypothetical protein
MRSCFARAFHAALNYGDGSGAAFLRVSRTRSPVARALLDGFTPSARRAVINQLATLDAADAAPIAGTHQTGALRYNGRRELTAIDVLQRHVVDPSDEQSLAAVLDKISGATLLESRQKQARLQLLAAVTEQMVVENKRARDDDAALMNMQLAFSHMSDSV